MNKIKIGYIPTIDHLILGVSKEKDGGHFQNFELKPEMYGNWDKMAEDCLNDEIDGAFFLFPLALDLYRKSKKHKLILLGHREGQVMVVRDEIKNIEDLRGKKIVVPHNYSTHHILLHQTLSKAGLSLDDVSVEFGFKKHPKEMVERLASGEISAFLAAEPMGTYAQQIGVGRILTISHDISRHHVDCVLVINKDLAEKNKDAVVELTRSLVRAGMFINAYPRQSAEIGSPFLDWPKKLLVEALTHNRGHILFWDLLPRLEDCVSQQSIAVSEMNLWNDEVDLNDFVDPSFAQEAYREWAIDTRKSVKDRGSDRTIPGTFTEAFNKLKSQVDASVVGVRVIRAGDKFPKAVHERNTSGSLDQFVERVFDTDNNIILEGDSKHVKGLAFLRPGENYEVDKVLIHTSKEDGLDIMTALKWGETDKSDVNLLRTDNLEIELLNPNHKISAFELSNGVLLSLDEEVFRILPLILKIN